MRCFSLRSRAIWRASVTVLLLAPSTADAQGTTTPPVVKVSAVQSPDGTLRRDPVQIVVTVESNQPLSGATLRLSAPAGLALREVGEATTKNGAPSSVLVTSLGTFAGSTSRSIMVDAASADLRQGSYRLLLDVLATDSTGRPRQQLAHDSITIAILPQIPTPIFLTIAMLAAVIGYALRIAVKVLSSVSPGQPLMEGNPKPGWLTQLVTLHYYRVDLAVTLVIAFFALLALIKDGHPPDSGATWYGAAGIGVGLGLLTNSELVTRLPKA